VGFTGGLLDPFKETPYGFAGYLVFAGLLKPIQGIQGVALHQFREKLSKGLLVAEALQAYHPSINCKCHANLAIYQPEGLEVLAQPVFLPFKEVRHGPGGEYAFMRSAFKANSSQIIP
jgi:hypothetical protein